MDLWIKKVRWTIVRIAISEESEVYISKDGKRLFKKIYDSRMAAIEDGSQSSLPKVRPFLPNKGRLGYSVLKRLEHSR